MSEIAKCPVCGEAPRIRHGGILGKEPVAYSHCGAEFASLGHWNKYAAAMDYAKKTAYWFSLPDGIKHPDDARAEKAMTDAETCVLEVFK